MRAWVGRQYGYRLGAALKLGDKSRVSAFCPLLCLTDSGGCTAVADCGGQGV